MPSTAKVPQSPLGLFADRLSPRLYDMIDDVSRVRHYSQATDEAYFRTVRELLGHSDVKRMMIYTAFLSRGGRGVRSPADGLAPRCEERSGETAYHQKNRSAHLQLLTRT